MTTLAAETALSRLDEDLLRAWEIWTEGNARDDGAELEELATRLGPAGYAQRDEGSWTLAPAGYARLEEIDPRLKPGQPSISDLVYGLVYWGLYRPLLRLLKALPRRLLRLLAPPRFSR